MGARRRGTGVVAGTLVVSLVLAWSTPHPSQAYQGASQPVEPARVFAAADLLYTHHIDAPDRTRLLTAALRGLRRAVLRAGAATSLTDLDTTSDATARASFSARLNLARERVQGRLAPAALADAAIATMAAGVGDRFSRFFPPALLAEIQRGGYGGVGVLFRIVEGRVYVSTVFNGGPAARAGGREFDQVLAVDRQPVRGLTQEEVARRVRGREGSAVRLTIRRPGRRTPLDVTLKRGLVARPLVSHRIYPAGIGYIRLHALAPGAGNAVAQSLRELQRQGLRAIVLDLRQNDSGGLREVDQVAGAFLQKGSPLYTLRGMESATGQTDRTPTIPQSLPLVVLIDADTYWVAEVLAAALSESGRARLVGTRTARQGAYGRLYALPGGGALLIKTGRLITAKGVLLERGGVSPDVVVPLRAADLDAGTDPQIARAVQMAREAR